MTTQILGETYELDFDNDLHQMLLSAVRDLESTDDSIRRCINSVRRSLDHAEQGLDSGYHLNELGVIQSSGVDLDRHCARRAEQIRGIKRLLHVAF